MQLRADWEQAKYELMRGFLRQKFARPELRARLLQAWPQLDIVAEARNGEEAVALVAQHRPDLAFLDIRMPGATGTRHPTPRACRRPRIGVRRSGVEQAPNRRSQRRR